MSTILPETAGSVNASREFDVKFEGQEAAAPVRPAVAKPKRRFTKSPTEALLALVRDPNVPLKRRDIAVMLVLAGYSRLLASKQRGMAFPSHQTIATQLGVSRTCVCASMTRIRQSGLFFQFKTRIAKGATDVHRPGTYSTPYYDLAPYWQLCGEAQSPRTVQHVRQYLDDAGYWRRGMVIERVKTDDVKIAQNSPFVDGDRVAKTSSGGGEVPHREDPLTVLQNEDTIKIQSSLNLNKNNKYNFPTGAVPAAPRPVLDPQGDFVFGRLIQIGYAPKTAFSHIRKYGPGYVEARLDYVLETQNRGGKIGSLPRLVCALMGQVLYGAKRSTPPTPSAPSGYEGVPAPQAAPTPRPAPQAAPVPMPPVRLHPAPAAPDVPKPLSNAALIDEIRTYSEDVQYAARLHVLRDTAGAEKLINPTGALEEFRMNALSAIRSACKIVSIQYDEGDTPAQNFHIRQFGNRRRK